MHVLKKYKAILLSGLLVVAFCAASYGIVGRADATDSKYTYAEHIFQDGTVNEINIEIDEEDWQDMLDNPLEEEYHQANITINGETIGNVAIRTKGNNSLTSVANSDSDRYSFKIDFDYYDDNGNYYGLKKLCLNNNYSDNSSMREYISYKIMGELGLDVPECGYSNITVNGEEWGLYLAVEAVDETFLATHFDDATGDLYKPEGQEGTGADLVYNGDDISSYTGLNLKTNEETSDGKEIIALMKALEDGENLEDVLDVEKALKYIAANVALANFDSYLGNTTHNYYLYEEDGYFTVIPWDMNLAFGGFGGGEVDIYEPTSQSMGGFGGPGGDGGDRKNEANTQNSNANIAADAVSTAAQVDTGSQAQPPDNGNMQGGGQPSDGSQAQPPDNGNMQGGGQPSDGSQAQPPDNGNMQGGGQPSDGSQAQPPDNGNMQGGGQPSDGSQAQPPDNGNMQGGGQPSDGSQAQPPDNGNMQGGGQPSDGSQAQPPDNGNMQGGGQPSDGSQAQPPDNGNMQGGGQPSDGSQAQPPDNGNMQGGGQPSDGSQAQPPDNGNMQDGGQPKNGNQNENSQSDNQDTQDMPQGMPSMGSDEKPLVTTLLANKTYLSMYEGYLREIAENYLTQEYMTTLVEQVHDLIAPYVEKDATAFCTYEEFEQACSTDPTDQYSLVYYAVNMAESIENQLAGGEPTFNTSSMKGGGMGGGEFGGGGERPEMPNRDGASAETTATNLTGVTDADTADTTKQAENAEISASAPADTQADSGQQNGQQNGQPSTAPDFGGGGKGENPPDLPGGGGGKNGGESRVTLSECLPTIAVCGGVFAVGVVVLVLFRRKKELKPPKETKN